MAIIEDTKDIREMLQLYFSAQKDFDLKVVAGSAEEFPMDRTADLDIVLCDIGLPGKSGTEITWLLKQRSPKLHVVMFTVFEDKDKIFQSLQAGASGYLLKNTPLPEIKEELLEVVNGGAAISSTIAKKVIDYFRLSKSKEQDINALTSREFEVLTHLKSGQTNKEIATTMNVSVDTVKFHIKNIYEKIHVKSRIELMNYFQALN